MRFWDDGVLRHNYNTDDMEHRVPELVEWATTVMTMNSGDLIACGTNHEGLGFLQDGETVDIEIQNIGKMTLKVRDPLKRTWEKGVYMGVDFDQSGCRQAPSPAGRRDRDGRDLMARFERRVIAGHSRRSRRAYDPAIQHSSQRRWMPGSSPGMTPSVLQRR